MYHPFHRIIGNLFIEEDFPECQILKDNACGGNHHLPLFGSEVKSNKTAICNSDLLIVKNNKVRVILEIEESNLKPIQICGKILTSAIARFYIHETNNDIPLPMDDSVTFIQILNSSILQEGNTKKDQWENVQHYLNEILPLNKIKKFRTICGSNNNFMNRTSGKGYELIFYSKSQVLR